MQRIVRAVRRRGLPAAVVAIDDPVPGWAVAVHSEDYFRATAIVGAYIKRTNKGGGKAP